MRVRDVMTRSVVPVEPATSIVAAAGVMTERGFTLLPVVDGGAELFGVVTEADLTRDRAHVDHGALRPGEPVRLRPVAPTTVAEVSALMIDTGVRGVPVVDDDRPVGIVTCHDVLKAVCREDETIAHEVRRSLARYGDSSRRQVRVRDSQVGVLDVHGADELERHIVSVLVGAVPGVVGVDVRGLATST